VGLFPPFDSKSFLLIPLFALIYDEAGGWRISQTPASGGIKESFRLASSDYNRRGLKREWASALIFRKIVVTNLRLAVFMLWKRRKVKFSA
jgi:hypothetical protein